MKLYQKTRIGLRYRHWSILQALAYFMKEIEGKLKIPYPFFAKAYGRINLFYTNKKWLKRNGEELYYDFKGAKIPAIPKNKISKHRYYAIPYLLDETFLMSCFFNDNYDKNMVEYIDNIIGVSVYGYTDGDFDVTVKKGDIVIDAGAWIGDFSAYAVTKGATAYAFEPASENYCILCETEKLNNVNGGGANLLYSKRVRLL